MKTLILFLCLVSSAVFARIGETVAQCQARYGAPIKWVVPDKTGYFEKDELRLLATFRNSKCVHLSYTKIEASKQLPTFSDEEIDALLKANGGGAKSSKIQSSEDAAEWQSSDGKLTATYLMRMNLLIIQTAAEKELGKKPAQLR